MAFGSASIVAQALHNVRLKGATNTMTQRSMNFVLVKPQQNKWWMILQHKKTIMSQQWKSNMIIFSIERHVLLCERFCKTKMKQATVCTSLVYWIGLTNLSNSNDNNPTYCQHKENSKDLCCEVSIWFHVPFDKSQRLSKKTITDKCIVMITIKSQKA